MAIKMDCPNSPPHTIRIIYVDSKKHPDTIYHNVDNYYYDALVWKIKFMDGRTTCVQYALVLRLETIQQVEETTL